MNCHAPPPVDLLTTAVECVRPLLATGSTKERIRVQWATAKEARDLAAGDVVRETFTALALEVGLIDERGYWTGGDVRADIRRHGAEDVAHVVAWALRGWNPFEKGPLK